MRKTFEPARTCNSAYRIVSVEGHALEGFGGSAER
jgi:hypothetical protein